VASILAESGVEPATERRTTRAWKRFIKAHWDSLYVCDFFSVETLGLFGMVRYMVFFVIEVKSRAVQIAGIAVDPGEEWMKQVARNLVDPVVNFQHKFRLTLPNRSPPARWACSSPSW
jgi:putative transposase